MTTWSSTIAALTLALLPAAFVTACGSGSEAHTEGEAVSGAEASNEARVAPPFALETLDGDSLFLADLADRKVILVNFWASWCEPCKEEVPVLIALHEEYADDGFMVLGATVDDLPRDARAFVEEMGIPYPSVITTPRMRETWQLAPWLPTTFLLVDGRITEEWVGPQTRHVFEYPIRVGLGQAPALEDVIRTEPQG